jgi:hypothetical protein
MQVANGGKERGTGSWADCSPPSLSTLYSYQSAHCSAHFQQKRHHLIFLDLDGFRKDRKILSRDYTMAYTDEDLIQIRVSSCKKETS